MEVIAPVLEKEVVDYEFMLTGNLQLKQVLDENAGDKVSENPEAFMVYLSEKPSPMNPDIMMPAEAVVIYKSQIMALVTRKRKQRLPTEEEKFNMHKLLHDVPDLVQ